MLASSGQAQDRAADQSLAAADVRTIGVISDTHGLITACIG